MLRFIVNKQSHVDINMALFVYRYKNQSVLGS